jgi:hypothetical protein
LEGKGPEYSVRDVVASVVVVVVVISVGLELVDAVVDFGFLLLQAVTEDTIASTITAAIILKVILFLIISPTSDANDILYYYILFENK